MTLKLAAALLTCVLTGACSPRAGAPLSVSGVVVPGPLPGTRMTAGYLTIDNNSDQPITIEKVTSPQFARVEMHETVIHDDIARMLPLAPLVVDRHSSVNFEPNGKHLMMSEALQEVVPGLQITVEFHYDSGGLLIVATTVGTRE